MRLPNRRRAVSGGVALATFAAVLAAQTVPAQASDNEWFGRKLVNDVTLDGVQRHLNELQRIADANGGNRAAGTAGYNASASYVGNTLAAAGLTVRYQNFEFPYFEQTGPTELERISPSPRTFTPDGEVIVQPGSGAGEITGTVQPVDVTIPPTPSPSSNSGCEAADFAGFTPGNIALIQRGTCTFLTKVTNAVGAGASAVIFFNEGQPGRTAPYPGIITTPVSVPAVGISYADGEQFYQLTQAGPVTTRVKVSAISEIRTTTNVIADTFVGRPDNVMMAGAHLDSVPHGAGINDNGSGVAALLEVAVKANRSKINNRLRFAFWGAEEYGLLGSQHYVLGLPTGALQEIKLYLNFDMIASPNYGRFLYDGDDSDGVGLPAGPPGSAQIEALFTQHFGSTGKPVRGVDLNDRSDHALFVAFGVPAGGIFTGIDEIKTAEQATLFGGTAGAPFDPCYHKACDTGGNYSPTALIENADAIGFVLGRYAIYAGDIPNTEPARATEADRTDPARFNPEAR